MRLSRQIGIQKTGWWQLKYFLCFNPNLGEMVEFDEYFSDGLKPPTRRSQPSGKLTWQAGLFDPDGS